MLLSVYIIFQFICMFLEMRKQLDWLLMSYMFMYTWPRINDVIDNQELISLLQQIIYNSRKTGKLTLIAVFIVPDMSHQK